MGRKKAQVDQIYRGKRLNLIYNDANTITLIFKTKKIGQVKTFLQFKPKIGRKKVKASRTSFVTANKEEKI